MPDTKTHMSRDHSLSSSKKIQYETAKLRGRLTRIGMMHSSHKCKPNRWKRRDHWPKAPLTERRRKFGCSFDVRPASCVGPAGAASMGIAAASTTMVDSLAGVTS